MRTKQEILKFYKIIGRGNRGDIHKNREKFEEAKRNILKMQEENCRNFNKKRKKAYQFSSGLHEKKRISTAADSVRSGWPLCNRLWSRHPIESLNETKHAVFARRRSWIQCEPKNFDH
ncbi:hypothetical protein TNCV_2657621 [Trichonephila clavipes]|nr:hypothetical protein TNCV_2657621 [Trichonephila clavipes]